MNIESTLYLSITLLYRTSLHASSFEKKRFFRIESKKTRDFDQTLFSLSLSSSSFFPLKFLIFLFGSSFSVEPFVVLLSQLP